MRTRSPMPGRRASRRADAALRAARAARQPASSDGQQRQRPPAAAAVWLAANWPQSSIRRDMPRQGAAGALVDLGEARHHVGHQEHADAAAHQQQDGRIDGGADDLGAHRVDALLVVDVAFQRARQVAGAFGRAHDADVQRREQRPAARPARWKSACLRAGRPAGVPARARSGGTGFLFQQGFQRLRRCPGPPSAAPAAPG